MSSSMHGHSIRLGVACWLASAALSVQTLIAGTVADDFNTSHDYLVNGVAGTIWDGMYTGAGSVPGGNIGLGPGATVGADANLTGAGVLTVRSQDTGWMYDEDDGFFLYRNVGGDFQMEVHIVAPFDRTQFNMAGLMVRAAGPGGAPLSSGESWLWLTHFSELGVGNYISSTISNQTSQYTLPASGVDTNYWLRVERVSGTSFYFYQKTRESDPWQLAHAPIQRPDLAGLDLQVGIIQQTFTTSTVSVQFDDFILSGASVPEPSTAALAGSGLLTALLKLRRRNGQRPH